MFRVTESRSCPDDLPSAYPLRDLFDAAVRGYTIRLTCRKCGHARILHAHALWWKFHRRGWPSRFRDLRSRCLCLDCLRNRSEIVRNPRLDLVHEPITGDPLPLPPKHEWEKELSRRR
jgi:hypothetical protein